MKKTKYYEIETTMSEMLLRFFSTEDGIDVFKMEAGENWEKELEKFKKELRFNIEQAEEDKIIIRARSGN